MNPLDDFIAAAKKNKKRIALAEGDDPRIIDAAIRATVDGLAIPVLVGDETTIHHLLKDRGADPAQYDCKDPKSSPLLGRFIEIYYDLRKHKGVTGEAAKEAMLNPLGFATMLTQADETDGTIGGAVATTADTVRAALQIIGRAPGVETVSSFFLIGMHEDHHDKKGLFLFSDCALHIEPDATALAQIALASADSFKAFTGTDARVALLSFSTAGSAAHPNVYKIAEAAKLARAARPDIVLDGDIQFDAAFVPQIGATKAPDSPLKGDANVFVFPNLEAGNIGYKIAQRIGRATALGPVLQGLNKPANDLSRGCSAEDVYHMIAVTSVQAS